MLYSDSEVSNSHKDVGDSMDKKLSILLVEDDPDACAEIEKYVEDLDDIRLAGTTGDSNKALDFVKCFLPDVVILDLELHYGKGNGLQFLKELKQMELPFHPYILITTNNSSIITYKYARQAGADFIMAKYQADYSGKGAIEFIRLLKSTIINKIEADSPQHKTTESHENKEKRIFRRIGLELDYIGINPKHLGYKYLADAIRVIIDSPTNNLYEIIGKRYGKTEASVERAMQTSIEKAWRTSDIEDLLKYYTARINSEKGVPTVTEFIYYYAKKIRNEY